jgi:hypothetical protein
MKSADAATRIRWAKAILDPEAKAILGSEWKRAVAESVEGNVRAMLLIEARHLNLTPERASPLRPTNKEEKRAVKSLASGLRRLNAALRNSNLPPGIRELLPADELQKRQIALDEMADISMRKPEQPRSNLKKKRPGRSNLRWTAAQYASLTLQELGIKRKTTRHKTFHKLAAAYYGDQKADLFDYICFYHDVDHLDAAAD